MNSSKEACLAMPMHALLKRAAKGWVVPLLGGVAGGALLLLNIPAL